MELPKAISLQGLPKFQDKLNAQFDFVGIHARHSFYRARGLLEPFAYLYFDSKHQSWYIGEHLGSDDISVRNNQCAHNCGDSEHCSHEPWHAASSYWQYWDGRGWSHAHDIILTSAVVPGVDVDTAAASSVGGSVPIALMDPAGRTLLKTAAPQAPYHVMRHLSCQERGGSCGLASAALVVNCLMHAGGELSPMSEADVAQRIPDFGHRYGKMYRHGLTLSELCSLLTDLLVQPLQAPARAENGSWLPPGRVTSVRCVGGGRAPLSCDQLREIGKLLSSGLPDAHASASRPLDSTSVPEGSARVPVVEAAPGTAGTAQDAAAGSIAQIVASQAAPVVSSAPVMSRSRSHICHAIVNYHAPVLGQTRRGGHFSPLGAYHAETDRFLVIDVNTRKYHPLWVSSELLLAALNTVDRASGCYRGLCLVQGFV